MRKEYDFRKADFGKYAARYAAGTNVVLLDPDIAPLSPDSKSVNDTLRALVRIAELASNSASRMNTRPFSDTIEPEHSRG